MLASVLLMDSDGRRLLHGAAPSLPASYNNAVHGLPIGPCMGSCGTAAYRGEPVFVENIQTDPLWAPFREIAEAHGLRASWSMPIKAVNGRVLGTFANYYRQPRKPSRQDLEAISLVAHTAALAIELHMSEQARRESEARWRGLFERMQEGFFVGEAIRDHSGQIRDFRLVEANPAFETLTGIAPNDVLGRPIREAIFGIEDALIDACARVVETAEPRTFELPISALGNRWYEGRVRPAGDNRFAVLFLEITDRKQAEERQAVLMNELQHRVKNTLSTVQAIAAASARYAPDKETFHRNLTERLVALGQTHSLLLGHASTNIPLRELLFAELKAYDDTGCQRINLSGPGVQLSSQIAMGIGMAVHELATNAAKYGALSVPAGCLDISWSLVQSPSDSLAIKWVERDGPRVMQPTRTGFGSHLLNHLLERQLNAKVSIYYRQDGVCAEIELPL